MMLARRASSSFSARAPAAALAAAAPAFAAAYATARRGLFGWRPWTPVSGPVSDGEKWNEAIVDAGEYRTGLRDKAMSAIVPRASPERVYDIKYYTHSKRRAPDKKISMIDLQASGMQLEILRESNYLPGERGPESEGDDKPPACVAVAPGGRRRSLFKRPDKALHIHDYTGSVPAPQD